VEVGSRRSKARETQPAIGATLALHVMDRVLELRHHDLDRCGWASNDL
jgi:hypothetical protein